MKTNKSYKKRLRVTKNGKIIGRKPGQNHFNAKERRNAQSKKGQGQQLAHYFKPKDVARFLPGVSPRS